MAKQALWRIAARKMIPEMAKKFTRRMNIGLTFFLLEKIFNSPDSSVKTKRRIMQFAHWCWSQPDFAKRVGRLKQASECNFIEDIVNQNEDINWPIFKAFFSDKDIRDLSGLWHYKFHPNAKAFMTALLASDQGSRKAPSARVWERIAQKRKRQRERRERGWNKVIGAAR